MYCKFCKEGALYYFRRLLRLHAVVMHLFPGWIIVLVQLSFLATTNSAQPPNIIAIYADDLGWNDVSFHGSPQIPTPNIDALALNGISLQNYYGEWLCTPSRAALFTGKYPMRLGLQHLTIRAGEASGLPLNETTLPQRLKEFGYATHMIGKWHLGYQSKEYTPTYRGFDSFYGYWNGFIDYYDHTYQEDAFVSGSQPFFGQDYHDGLTPVQNQGKYVTHDFTDRAKDIIKKHDTSKPLFLFFAHLACHSGNSYQMSQAPPELVSQLKYIDNLNRRIQGGVMMALDESVGATFNALHERDMLNNTIFLFISDNGGEIDPGLGFGSNYPLRGNKMSFWEGGIHVPAIIWSPLLNLDKPRISDQLMHVSDWLPTLYTLAGGDVDDLGTIDGINMWDAIVNDTPSPRTEMLQNLDPIAGCAAFRRGPLKLAFGTPPFTIYNFWDSPSGFEEFNGPATYDWVFKRGSVVRDVLEQMGRWIVEDPDEVYGNLRLTCERPPENATLQCASMKHPCLFNITDDPCEYYNIADNYPEVVEEMIKVVLQFRLEERWPQNKPRDHRANPMCHNFQHVPWLDPDYYQECDFLSKRNSTKNK